MKGYKSEELWCIRSKKYPEGRNLVNEIFKRQKLGRSWYVLWRPRIETREKSEKQNDVVLTDSTTGRGVKVTATSRRRVSLVTGGHIRVVICHILPIFDKTGKSANYCCGSSLAQLKKGGCHQAARNQESPNLRKSHFVHY